MMMRIPILFVFLLELVLSLPLNVQAEPPTQDGFQPYEELWQKDIEEAGDGSYSFWVDPKQFLSWSQDSQTLAVIAPNTITIYDAETAESVLQIPMPDDQILWIDMNPHSAEIIGTSGDQIYLWSTTTGELLQSYPIESQWVAWSPDGEQFAATSYDGEYSYIEIFAKETGDSQQKFTVWGATEGVIWTPDGTQLIAKRGYENRYIQVWDMETSELINLFSGGDVELNTTGSQMAINSGFWTYIYDYETSLVETRLPARENYHTTWHPNGEILTLANEDGSIDLWQVSTAEILQHIVSNQVNRVNLAWSPDGQYLASVGDGMLQVWSVAK